MYKFLQKTYKNTKPKINSKYIFCFQLHDTNFRHDTDLDTHSVSMSIDWCISYCSSKTSDSSWLSKNKKNKKILLEINPLIILLDIYRVATEPQQILF